MDSFTPGNPLVTKGQTEPVGDIYESGDESEVKSKRFRTSTLFFLPYNSGDEERGVPLASHNPTLIRSYGLMMSELRGLITQSTSVTFQHIITPLSPPSFSPRRRHLTKGSDSDSRKQKRGKKRTFEKRQHYLTAEKKS